MFINTFVVVVNQVKLRPSLLIIIILTRSDSTYILTLFLICDVLTHRKKAILNFAFSSKTEEVSHQKAIARPSL